MENNREEQIEALKMASEYCQKLTIAIDNIVEEFENGRLDDTEEYAKSVLDGINWTIQVYNGTKEYLQEIDSGIDEDRVNQSVAQLKTAYDEDDDNAKAAALKGGLKEFVEKMIAVAEKVC